MKFTFLAAFLALVVLMVSCITGPVVIPDGLTSAELIQRGQEASDKNRYSVSLQYYEAVIERYPFDIENVIAAEYEIAFIHYKQKQYNQAKTEFHALLQRYEVPDEELLPAQFKILSNIVLAKIEEAENILNTGKSPFRRQAGSQG